MAGFVGYKRKVLESISSSAPAARGYVFQAEVKYKCQKRGFKIKEMPIIFKNRNLGDSKIKKRDMIEALLLVWRLRFFNA